MSTKNDGVLAQFHSSSFALPLCVNSKAEGMEESAAFWKPISLSHEI